MLTFRYDRTFEGLLSVVYDAYNLRISPDHLIGEGEVEPMFSERVIDVVVSKQKADRVWAGLTNKLPREVCNMLMHTWLAEIHGGDELLFRYIKKVFDGGGKNFTNFADEDILEVKKVAQKVSKEALFMIQFVRFQKAGDDSFFAAVSPQYNVLPLIIDHFKDRFADQKWLIYDLRRKYGYYYDLEGVTEVTLLDEGNFSGGRLDEQLMAEDEKMFQELWRGYFKSMTIKERINPKLHRKNMPRRFWKYLTEKD